VLLSVIRSPCALINQSPTALDRNLVADADAVLFSACLYYCKHRYAERTQLSDAVSQVNASSVARGLDSFESREGMQCSAQKPERNNQHRTEYDASGKKLLWSEPSASAAAPFDSTLSPAVLGR
jgi:hypothetical protein